MKKLIERIKPTGFARNVSVLVGGTAISQVLSIIALPLLTRLYEPDDFAVLAVYVSIFAIISSVACLRFEIAIPIPEGDEEAVNLLVLSVLSVFFVTALTIVATVFFDASFAALIQKPEIEPYLYLVPVGVLIAGFYASVQFLATRFNLFVPIAKTRISQAVGGVVTQVGMGLLGYGALGLMIGQIVNFGSGVASLGIRCFAQVRPFFGGISFESLKKTFVKHQRFPKYSALEALSNTASMQLPVLIISAFMIGPEIGYLMLATKILAAPMGLLGRGVSQVYLSQAPNAYREGRLSVFTVEIVGKLLKVGIPPLIFGSLLSPALFPVVFGVEWQRAGVLVLWMAPWFVFHFLSSPVSMALHITGHQRTALVLQLFGLLFRCGLVLATGCFFEAFVTEVYAISGAAFYLVYLYVVARVLKVTGTQFFSILRLGLFPLFFSVLLASLAYCLINNFIN